MVPIILGSSSPWRKRILDDAQIPHLVRTADLDESLIGDRSGDPERLTLLLAKAKADAIIAKGELPNPCLLITCDQVVVFKGELLEKPRDTTEALRRLRSYRNRRVSTVSAVRVTNTATGLSNENVDLAGVTFGDLPDSVIMQAIVQGDVLTCAGSFAHENPILAPYVKEIHGDATSVTGLPLPLLRRLLGYHLQAT